MLNTGVDGYYNYTLDYSDSAEETGKINVQKLTLQVSADNAEVEYGNAVTPSVTTVISKGETPLTEEEISALGAVHFAIFLHHRADLSARQRRGTL